MCTQSYTNKCFDVKKCCIVIDHDVSEIGLHCSQLSAVLVWSLALPGLPVQDGDTDGPELCQPEQAGKPGQYSTETRVLCSQTISTQIRTLNCVGDCPPRCPVLALLPRWHCLPFRPPPPDIQREDILQ